MPYKKIPEYELFEKAFNTSAIGMSIVSSDNHWLKVNNAFLDLIGYTEEELKKLTWMDITHPDDIEPDFSLSIKAMNGDIDQYDLEKRYITKSGKIIWVKLTVSIIFHNEFKCFIVHAQDITEIKMFIERRTKALENAGIGVWSWDGWKDELIWDDTMFKLYDINEDEFVPKYSFFNNRVHENDREDIAKVVEESIRNNTNFFIKFRIILKDGSTRWLLGCGVASVDSLGNISMINGINMDITDTEESNQKAIIINDIFKEKLRELDRVSQFVK